MGIRYLQNLPWHEIPSEIEDADPGEVKCVKVRKLLHKVMRLQGMSAVSPL
jgi:hypothetical protein